MDSRRVSLDEIVVHFQELEDPHSTINQWHPLPSVLVIVLLAVLASVGGPTAIGRWALLKKDLLLRVLDLPNGVPEKDIFRRVLLALKPAAFLARFTNWVRLMREEAAAETGVEQPVLAVDGKTSRRSHDHNSGLGALHTVSVGASENGLSLGQMACTEKSNVITAIPELLRLVEINGAIITMHWLHVRTTNPIESTSATVRLRTVKTKGCGSRVACLTVVFKLMESASKSWRSLNGSDRLRAVISGARFVEGIEVKDAA
jgi:predicted transposase YbfD/YdcC